jgi:transcription initiation factor TFIIE subunit alpha
MDHAQTLIRSVVRTFYELKHVIIVDALMVHSALSVDDLHHLTGIQQKDIRKLLGKLKEDRLVSLQSRQEVKVGNQRPMHRDYYYINFHATIDAIKYRVFFLTQKVKDLYKPSDEKKDYYCPRCQAKWTQLEVLDKACPEGFMCHRCNGILERDEISAADRAGHQRQSKLMSQIDPFLELLKQIDSEEIPQNDFQSALARQVPVDRDRETHPVQETTEVKPEVKQPSKLKQEVNMEVKVNFITEEGTNAAEAEAKLRKAEQEKQNALPSWYTHSTVDGMKVDPTSPVAATAAPISSAGIKAEETDKKNVDIKHQSEVEQYFASLREEQERAAAEQDSDASTEDEDDGFEDVEIGGAGAGGTTSTLASGIGTPNSSVSQSISSSAALLNGNGKRSATDDAANAPGTGTGTGTLNDSAAKKIKVEDKSATPVPQDKAEQFDSDEEEEFEDAL